MELQINDPNFANKRKAIDVLYQVLDQELMVNIFDLGLVYEIDFSKGGTIRVIMTLTSKGCPPDQAIGEGVKNAVGEKFSDREMDVDIVWEPQWTFEEISNAGREQLGL